MRSQATIGDVMNSVYHRFRLSCYAVPSDLGVEMEELEDKHMKPFILSLRGIDLTGNALDLAAMIGEIDNGWGLGKADGELWYTIN